MSNPPKRIQFRWIMGSIGVLYRFNSSRPSLTGSIQITYDIQFQASSSESWEIDRFFSRGNTTRALIVTLFFHHFICQVSSYLHCHPLGLTSPHQPSIFLSERQSKYRLAGTRPLPGEPVFGNVTISPTLCFIKSHPNWAYSLLLHDGREYTSTPLSA